MASNQHRSGFSLLELIVVLIIVSVVACLVSLTLRTHFERAALVRAQATAGRADQLCRQLANRLPAGQVRLEVHSSGTKLTVFPINREFKLPRKTRITSSVARDANGRKIQTSTFHHYAPGISEDCLLHFECGVSSQWMGILGVSGQTLPFRSEPELLEVFP